MPYRQGDIVYANILDPEGNPCDTPHPAMLLQKTEVVAKAIAEDRSLWVVGITGEFTLPLQDGWFELPYVRKPKGPHPATHLSKPSVLKCNWRRTIEPRQIINEAGHVPLNVLKQAVEWIRADIERQRRDHGG